MVTWMTVPFGTVPEAWTSAGTMRDRAAEEGSDEGVAGAADLRDRLEGAGVHDFGVIGGGKRLGVEHAAHRGLEMQGVARAGGDFLARGVERAIENSRSAALAGLEVGIAAGKRQAVGLAYDGADDDVRVQVQIADELLHDARLLRVLASKVSEVGLDDFKKF